jgi:hypothetical protein
MNFLLLLLRKAELVEYHMLCFLIALFGAISLCFYDKYRLL